MTTATRQPQVQSQPEVALEEASSQPDEQAIIADYEARRARVDQINGGIRQLPLDKLNTVFDFVDYLLKQQPPSETFQLMRASEPALRRDWDNAAEDEAWCDL